MKKCTSKTGRHTWQHVDNFNQESKTSGKGKVITVQGLYKCKECSATKKGNPA